MFIYDSFGKKVLVKQMSNGSLEDETLCMDTRFCAERPDWIIANRRLFLFEYDDFGDYFPKQTVIDTFGNEASRRDKISLTPVETGAIGMLSLPQARQLASG
ncbi:MAG: hypothetical protein H6765_04820 [Candidatus Peribacteria bacterium]|nr:MAG: hypothetical protein H6765_04820 [Candidatus Peribacteria bacterium]